MHKFNTVYAKHLGDSNDVTLKSSYQVVSCSTPGIFASHMARNLTFACLNFLIHVDLDIGRQPISVRRSPCPFLTCHSTSHLHSPCGMGTKGTLVSR
jgi:hypothetical protein